MTLHGYETYIDGVPASSFNAECVSRNIAPAAIISFTDWTRQSINPLRYGSTTQFKVIKLQFRFEYFSDEDLLTYAGGLTNALRNCQLKFDNMKYYFDCALSDSALTQVDGGKQELAVTLQSSYAYLPPITVLLTSQSQSITAQGNLPSPAVVTLTPSQDIGSVSLTGLSKKPIKVSNLHANAPVAIDGESCIVTEPDLDTIMTASAGAGKWMLRKYATPNILSPDVNVTNYQVSKADIPDQASYTQQLVPDSAALYTNGGDNYVGLLKTGLYVASAKTISIYLLHDDGAQIYLNGTSVYQSDHAAGDTISFSLSAGWSKLEILWMNHYGLDGIYNISPLFGSQVDQLNAYYARDASPGGIVNKFPDCDMWSWPTISPGEQTVAINSSAATASVQYKPKFM